MHKQHSSRALNVALLILSLCLALGVATVFRPCAAKEDGTWMNCHRAGLQVLGVGIALCAVNALRWLRRLPGAALDAVSMVLAAAVMLIPGPLTHLCMMADMRCNAIMRPAATVLGALILLLALIDLILRLARRR